MKLKHCFVIMLIGLLTFLFFSVDSMANESHLEIEELNGGRDVEGLEGCNEFYGAAEKETEELVIDSTNIASGSYGQTTWIIDSEGKLTVSGTGEVKAGEYHPEWCEYSEQILSAQVTLTGIKDLSYFFSGCTELKQVDLSGLDSSQVENMQYMFWCCQSLEEVDISGLDTSRVENMQYMFSSCCSLKKIDLSGLITSNLINMEGMFYECWDLSEIVLEGFNTSKVITMKSLFSECGALKELNLSGFDTSNVENMWAMFYDCKLLRDLDLRSFNTSNVTNMGYMFGGCSGMLSVNVSSFDTSNVTNMQDMFWKCNNLESVDVSHFNTSKVTDMGAMFNLCESLKSLDVRNFNTSNVQAMCWMFAGNHLLTSIDVTGFDTSKCWAMWSMFNSCDSLREIDVSGFNTSEATNISYIFKDCKNLEHIDMSSFDLTKADEQTGMLSGCSSLLTVKSPKVTSKSIDLPGDEWKRFSTGDAVKAIPANEPSGTLFLKGEATIRFNMNKITIKPGDSVTIKATPVPDILTISELKWESSNPEIISVVKTDGMEAELRAGDQEGEAVITVTAGSIVQTIPVKITAPLVLKTHNLQLKAKSGADGIISAEVMEDYIDSVSIRITDKNGNPNTELIDVRYETTLGGYRVTVKDGIDCSEPVELKIIFSVSDAGKEYSDVCEISITSGPQAQRVLANIESSRVPYGTQILLTSQTPRVNIFYTLDGTEPTSVNGILYEKPIILSQDICIKAVAVGKGLADSPISEYKYEIAEEWGDINESMRSVLFGDKITNVPYGTWYTFGEGTKLYESASNDEIMILDATGAAVTFDGEIYVFHGTRRLFQNRDYTTKYTNNKLAGKYNDAKAPSVRITGKGSYKGSNTFKFTIKPTDSSTGSISLKKVKINNLASSVVFCGSAFTLETVTKDGKNPITLTDGTRTLEEGVHYNVTMKNYGATGKMSITFTGMGDYKGSITKTVTVKPYNIKKETSGRIRVTVSDAEYCKSGAVPNSVLVTFENKEKMIPLVEGIDYTLSYRNNKVIRANKNPVVTVKGIGNFTGSIMETYSISKAKASKITLVAQDKAFLANAKAGYFKSVPKLMDDSKPVIAGKNKDVETIDKNAYHYYYAEDTILANGTERHMDDEIPSDDIVPAGTTIRVEVSVTCSSSSAYMADAGGTVLKGHYQILEKSKNIGTAKISVIKGHEPEFDNGRLVVPLRSSDLKVMMGNDSLKPEDYEIVSITNNRFPGSASMVIRGCGEYGGMKAFTFKIRAKRFL